jgi:hypothetical protein
LLHVGLARNELLVALLCRDDNQRQRHSKGTRSDAIEKQRCKPKPSTIKTKGAHPTTKTRP